MLKKAEKVSQIGQKATACKPSQPIEDNGAAFFSEAAGKAVGSSLFDRR